MDNPGTAMAITHDLGLVFNTTKSVTFAVGVDEEPAVEYMGKQMSAYWRSECQDIACGCVRALDEFDAAKLESNVLNDDILLKSSAVGGPAYAEVAMISLRQAFGAIDLTVPRGSSSEEQMMAYVKDMGANGTVNALDAIVCISPMH